MIRNVKYISLFFFCVGFFGCIKPMEEREKKQEIQQTVNTEKILKNIDYFMSKQDLKGLNLYFQNNMPSQGTSQQDAHYKLCTSIINLLNKSFEIDKPISNATRVFLVGRLATSYFYIDGSFYAEEVRALLTTDLIENIIKSGAHEAFDQLISIFTGQESHKEKYNKLKKALETSSEVYRSVAEARKTNCFKDLLVLRKRPDIKGTPSEGIIESVIVQMMGGLFPHESLLDGCWAVVNCNKELKKKMVDIVPIALQQVLQEQTTLYSKPGIILVHDSSLPFEDLFLQGCPNPYFRRDLFNLIKKKDVKGVKELLKNNSMNISEDEWDCFFKITDPLDPLFIKIIMKIFPQFTKQDLLSKAVKHDHVLLTKKLILRGADLSSMTFKSKWNIDTQAGRTIFLLLNKAGVTEKQLVPLYSTHYQSFLSFILSMQSHWRNCPYILIDHLNKLKEMGYRFNFVHADGGTVLKQALMTEHLEFISFLINTAHDQKIEIKELLNPKEIFYFLLYYLRYRIWNAERIINNFEIIKKLIELDPSVKTKRNRAENKTLLDYIMRYNELAQDPKIVALFTPDQK